MGSNPISKIVGFPFLIKKRSIWRTQHLGCDRFVRDGWGTYQNIMMGCVLKARVIYS